MKYLSDVTSWGKRIWGSIIALLPSVLFLIFGIAFTVYSLDKIHDPEGYLSPFQRPLAQNYLALKLILGGGMGFLSGSSLALIVLLSKQYDQKWKPFLTFLKVMNIGIALLLAGGLPKPEYLYLIPLTDFIIAWSPFRIAFIPAWMIGFAIVFFVISLHVASKIFTER